MHKTIKQARQRTSRRIWKGDLSRQDPITRSCLKRFAINLLGMHEFTHTFLSLVITMLNRGSRHKLSDYMKANWAKKDDSWSIRSLDNERLGCGIVSAMDGNCLKVQQKDVERFLANLLRMEDGEHVDIWQKDSRLAQLQEMTGLSNKDLDVVCFLHCYRQYKSFETFCDGFDLGTFINLISMATRLTCSEVRDCLAAKGRLIEGGLIEKESRYVPFTLGVEISDYLAGMGPAQLGEKYVKKVRGSVNKTESFPVVSHSTEIIRALLTSRRPCNILLYGKPGTGKTEFAKSIISEIGGESYFVQYAEPQQPERHSGPNRRLAIKAATRTIALSANNVLVVDEADQFLNTRYFMFGSNTAQDKGWINDFLDNSQHKIIWICNETVYIEESTLRRFSYSLRFQKFTRRERENVWQKLADRHPLKRLLSAELLKDMASRYEANAAGIAAALSSLKAILPPKKATPDTVRRTLSDLLERHLEATGHDPREKLNHLAGNYDIGALNTDTPAEEILRSLKGFAEFLQHDTGQAKRHVNLLFWGQPGTGKTEFAKYLADQLSMGLLVKRASDLLNPYVGVTEMQIRDTFEEAERDRSLLFIDEADSMFINRETAVRSWETAQTNELLTQMENFKGILICCTNLLDHLDGAVVRRFAWKVQFKPLTNEGKLRLFEKYFLSGKALAPEQAGRLAAVNNLTAGDFKAVWDKYQFVTDPEHRGETLIEELGKEVEYRKDKVGNIGFKR